jgi:transcription-repair coupling factor (superfamily II helicase)
VNEIEIPVEIFITTDEKKTFICKPVTGELYLKPQDPFHGQLTHFRADTKVGSLVMHEKYGLGRFVGAKKMEIGGKVQSYLMLQYSGRAIVYVPFDHVNLLYNYHGHEKRLDRI